MKLWLFVILFFHIFDVGQSTKIKHDFLFAVCTDTHVGMNAARIKYIKTLLLEIKNYNLRARQNANPEIELLFITGDITHHGKREEFQDLRNLYDMTTEKGLEKLQIFPLLGNHDHSDKSDKDFSEIFSEYLSSNSMYYTGASPTIVGKDKKELYLINFQVVKNDVLFVCMDFNERDRLGCKIHQESYDWVKNRIRNVTSFKKVIFMNHQPLSALMWIHRDAMWTFDSGGRKKLKELFTRNNTYDVVDQKKMWGVITGHFHIHHTEYPFKEERLKHFQMVIGDPLEVYTSYYLYYLQDGEVVKIDRKRVMKTKWYFVILEVVGWIGFVVTLFYSIFTLPIHKKLFLRVLSLIYFAIYVILLQLLMQTGGAGFLSFEQGLIRFLYVYVGRATLSLSIGILASFIYFYIMRTTEFYFQNFFVKCVVDGLNFAFLFLGIVNILIFNDLFVLRELNVREIVLGINHIFFLSLVYSFVSRGIGEFNEKFIVKKNNFDGNSKIKVDLSESNGSIVVRIEERNETQVNNKEKSEKWNVQYRQLWADWIFGYFRHWCCQFTNLLTCCLLLTCVVFVVIVSVVWDFIISFIHRDVVLSVEFILSCLFYFLMIVTIVGYAVLRWWKLKKKKEVMEIFNVPGFHHYFWFLLNFLMSVCFAIIGFINVVSGDISKNDYFLCFVFVVSVGFVQTFYNGFPVVIGVLKKHFRGGGKTEV